jgi:hypothetical protein
MRALLAIPATSLALAGAPAGGNSSLYPITGAEAAAAITAQIHKQVASELHSGFHAATQCSAQNPGSGVINATTRLAGWRCSLQLGGVHFAMPCKAQAYVFATDQPHHIRIDWLSMSQTCHTHAG